MFEKTTVYFDQVPSLISSMNVQFGRSNFRFGIFDFLKDIGGDFGSDFVEKKVWPFLEEKMRSPNELGF